MGDVYTNPPQSRNEAILRATIDGTEYTAPPQSRIEDLLLELKEAIEQGGAGGMSKDTYDPDDVVATAGGIAAYVSDEITDLDLGTAAFKNSTSVVTESSDLVESGAVFDALGFGNKNLFDPSILTLDGPLRYSPVYVGDGDFTLSTTAPLTVNNAAAMFFLAGNVDSGASTSNNGVWSDNPRTVTSINGYVTVVSRALDGVNPRLYTNQLEKGSTATAYEPYHASVEDTIPQVVSDAVGWDVGNLFDYNKFIGTNINNGTAVYENNGITLTSTANDCYNWARKISTEYGESGVIPWAVSVSEGDRIILLWDYEVGDANGLVYIFPNGITTGYVSKSITAKSIEYLVPSGVTFVSFRFGVQNANETNHYKNIVLRHLTVDEQKCDNSVIAPVENGSTTSQAYAVGSHAIRNGAFITWKNAKAQNEPINDASDYTSGDVADELDIIEITNLFCTNILSGYTLDSTSHVYKQGKHIIGDVIFECSSVIESVERNICTLTYRPRAEIVSACFLGDDKWSANAVGYLYMNVYLTVKNLSSQTAKAVKIHLDYITK